MNVVGDVARPDDLPQMLRSTPCDVLLLDIQMERSALAVLQDITKCVPVVVVTMSERPEDALAAVREGDRAVIFKRFAMETLLEAIHAVAKGRGVAAPRTPGQPRRGPAAADHRDAQPPRDRDHPPCRARPAQRRGGAQVPHHGSDRQAAPERRSFTRSASGIASRSPSTQSSSV